MEGSRFYFAQLRIVNFKRVLWVLIWVVNAVPPAIAQRDSATVKVNSAETKPLFSVGLGLQHGFIFAHSQDVQNTSGARPTGLEAIFSWQGNDSSLFSLCHCYPRQGLMLAYYDYDVGLLGRSGTVAYFLEPTYRISDRVFFSLKAAAGFSYFNNPYDSIDNPANQSYSTPLNFYLLVGVGVWLRLGEQWWLNPSINYQHISNGGLSDPNKGINWPTAGLSVSYMPESRPFYKGKRSSEKYWKSYSLRYDFTLMGSLVQGSTQDGDRKRFFMGGLAVQTAKQVGSLSMLTLGGEIYQDGSLEQKLDRDGVEASPVKAGLMLGHEFLLGRFQFSQRLGVYVFDQTPYYDRLFHRWGIKYRINEHFSTGINLLAHRQVAEFVDFRVGYSFQKKYK